MERGLPLWWWGQYWSSSTPQSQKSVYMSQTVCCSLCRTCYLHNEFLPLDLLFLQCCPISMRVLYVPFELVPDQQKKGGSGNNMAVCRTLSFFLLLPLLPSPPFSSDPRFCPVTDGFNYLLTRRTQQIHVINWACDCCGHRLESEEEEKEELFSSAAGGRRGMQVAGVRKKKELTALVRNQLTAI